MAWEDIGVAMLRILINDMDSTPTYSTCRLEELLCVAAHFNIQEITFDTTYTVSIPSTTISPDPASDVSFINFMVLKAACLVDQSTFRVKAALEGLAIKCGPAALTVDGHTQGFQTLLEKGPCAAYKELKDEYQWGDPNIIKSVLSPFVGNNFYPTDYYNVPDDNRSMKY